MISIYSIYRTLNITYNKECGQEDFLIFNGICYLILLTNKTFKKELRDKNLYYSWSGPIFHAFESVYEKETKKSKLSKNLMDEILFLGQKRDLLYDKNLAKKLYYMEHKVERKEAMDQHIAKFSILKPSKQL